MSDKIIPSYRAYGTGKHGKGYSLNSEAFKNLKQRFKSKREYLSH